MRIRRQSTPEMDRNMVKRENRDKGVIETGKAILIAGGLLAALIVYNNIKENEPAAAIPATSAAPTAPEASAPPIGGTASGTINGQPVETSPPVVAPTSPVAGGEGIPSGPINISYPFTSGTGEAESMDCSGEPFVIDTVQFKGGYSLYVGIDDKFPQDLVGIRSQNVSLATSIVNLSGSIDSRLTWNVAAPDFNVDNLHAPGNPGAPGRLAVGSNCYIGSELVIPPYVGVEG